MEVDTFKEMAERLKIVNGEIEELEESLKMHKEWRDFYARRLNEHKQDSE